MSASRQKKIRQNTAEVTTSAPEQKKGMSAAAKRAIAVSISVIVIVLVVFFYMINSGFFAAHTVAADAKGHDLSPAMVNYFYRGAYSQMASEVGEELMGYMLDTSLPLDEQECALDGYTTWSDYFMANGLQTASNYYSICDEAKANGYELSEDYVEYIDSTIEDLSLYALYNGMSDGNAFLAYQYGAGCNEKNYREYLEVVLTAQGYSEQIRSELNYTQDEIDAYYTENAQNFDAVNFHAYSVETNEDRSIEDCEALAKEMAEASKGNLDKFFELTVANASPDDVDLYNDNTVTLHEGLIYSSCSVDYRDWLFDEGRQSGDTTYIVSGEGEDAVCYVIYFLGEDDRSFKLPNVRHILFSTSGATDEEAKHAIKAQAEELLATFLASDPSESAFAELAKAHSQDNAEAGGLYESVVPGQMVAEFDDWCFDEARQVGDTGIVETTYGYHIMFYCGESDATYLSTLVENAMISAEYDSWYISVVGVPVYELKPFGKRFVTL